MEKMKYEAPKMIDINKKTSYGSLYYDPSVMCTLN
jgi:hypothetical protein